MSSRFLSPAQRLQRMSKSLNSRPNKSSPQNTKTAQSLKYPKSKSAEKINSLSLPKQKIDQTKVKQKDRMSCSLRSRSKDSSKISLKKMNNEDQTYQKSISTLFQFSYQCLKTTSRLIQKQNFDPKSLKKLLPPCFHTELPQPLVKLETICIKFDQFLFELPKKLRMENWMNIKNHLIAQYQIEIELETLDYINNAIPNYYLWYQDPLKNIVVSLPKGVDKKNIRRQEIRKQLIKYLNRLAMDAKNKQQILKNAKKQQIFEQLQIKYLIRNPIKTKSISFFFPVKEYHKKTIIYQNEPSQNLHPKQTFLAKMGSSVHKKSKYYDTVAQEYRDLQIADDILNRILSLTKKMYTSRSIFNLFKATILTQLIDQYQIPEKIAVIGLERLLMLENRCLNIVQYHHNGQIIQYLPQKYKQFAKQLKSRCNAKKLKNTEE